MSRILKLILLVNLVVLAALTFVYPELMVSPGKLVPEHKSLEGDCFACHAPLTGSSAQRCISCHKTADIGVVTTKGVPLLKPATKAAFHQELTQQDCVACHSDHAGVKRFAGQRRFDHALLKKSTSDQCETCHKSPTDTLHKQITGNCLKCHSQTRWTPATFDHKDFFELDGDHNAKCVTCHVRNDYSQFTCYGCHEHTPANIRRKHIKEGISKFDNCVECHRNADEHDIRTPGSGQRKSNRND